MKRTVTRLIITLLLGTTLSGCFGKFGLTRKIYQANSNVNDKVARSLVTWAFILVPVYGIAGLLDFVIFNTIEFWGGRNPVAQGEKEFQYAQGDETFKIHAQKQDDEIVYTIDHYAGVRYVDSTTIEWNTVTGVMTTGAPQTGPATLPLLAGL